MQRGRHFVTPRCRRQIVCVAPLSFGKKAAERNVVEIVTPRGDAPTAQATIPPRQLSCKIKEIYKVEAELNARRAVLPACHDFDIRILVEQGGKGGAALGAETVTHERSAAARVEI
jgi:hypothetical protein